MALMNLLRVSEPESSTPDATDPAPGAAPAWRTGLIGGAGGAATSLLLVLIVAGVAGSLAPRATTDWGQFFGVGAGLWLLMGGGRLAADGVFLAMTPLLGLALVAYVAVRAARWALPDTPDRLAYAGFAGGYAALAAGAVGIAHAGPATPVWWSLPLPLLAVPALALAIVDIPRGNAEPLVRHVPRALRRALRPALRTTAVAIGLGMALCALAVAMHLPDVGLVYKELDSGLLGALALTLGQLAAWPNLGLWGLAFLSGPGFTVTEGATVTLGSADSGLLPMVPAFAGLPGQQDFGWYVALLYLCPVLVGAYAARRALKEIPRLASSRTKLVSVAATVALTGALVGVLDAIGGGSLGDGRLADIGPSALALGVCLTLALALGAFVVLARDWWKLRR